MSTNKPKVAPAQLRSSGTGFDGRRSSSSGMPAGPRRPSHVPGYQPPPPSMAGALMNMIGLGGQNSAKLCRKASPRPPPAAWPSLGQSLEEGGAGSGAGGGLWRASWPKVEHASFDTGAKAQAAKALLVLNPKKEAARLRKAAQEAEEKRASFFPLGPLGLAGNIEREVRHGYYINPNPTCDLSTPPPPPPLTAEERAAREAKDRAATAAIPQNLDKYVAIVKNVSLFSEMGRAELEAAAKALELRHFQPGEQIYDEGAPQSVARDRVQELALTLARSSPPPRTRGAYPSP